MTSLFPGAVWRPMPGQEKRPARRKGRGVGFHVAVYTGPSIYDINLRTGNDAHLYVRLDGSVEQNVDLDLQAWAGADGNGSMIWVETAGGLGSSAQINAEPWNPAMAATLARIARWAHDTEGVPLELMPDSRPTSRGVGPHRLGIQHSAGVGKVPGWLVAGGERWSSVLGKECPGNAKVAQIPEILALAAGGAPTTQEDDMTPDEHDALMYLRDVVRDGGPNTPYGKSLLQLVQELPASTAHETWTGVFVNRPDAAGVMQKIPVLQELADAKTQAVASRAEAAGMQTALAAANSGQVIDMAAITAAVKAAASEALADGVKVTIDVPHGS